MTKIAITGARGFLGVHLRAAAQEYGLETACVPLGDYFDENQAIAAFEGAEKIVHLAGVNRGSDNDIAEGNILFAKQLVGALEKTNNKPQVLVYANSIQAGNDTVYGAAKQHAGEVLSKSADLFRYEFKDIRLPNLFGEYGQPFYNSVVATFAHVIANKGTPEVSLDKELQLLHAQNAADILLGQVNLEHMNQLSHHETVSGIKGLLEEFAGFYSVGEFPDLSTSFRRDLFNTYRAYTFPDFAPIRVDRHADHRGAFFEIIRSRGGTGQTSFSTTAPGITRGDHYHRRKVERFTVLAGDAEIKLRRVFDDRVFRYRISGNEPQSVDMPTLYTHSIRNVGSETLYTAFWTNDIFDPDNSDTIAEVV